MRGRQKADTASLLLGVFHSAQVTRETCFWDGGKQKPRPRPNRMQGVSLRLGKCHQGVSGSQGLGVLREMAGLAATTPWQSLLGCESSSVDLGAGQQ